LLAARFFTEKARIHPLNACAKKTFAHARLSIWVALHSVRPDWPIIFVSGKQPFRFLNTRTDVIW
jgi:hypothetical protein